MKTATGPICAACGERITGPVGDGPDHTPNHIAREVRAFYLLASTALVLYGAIGLWFDDIPVPGKRGRWLHFHGASAWIAFSAMLCACANLLSVIVDHYDRRNNETGYRLFAKAASFIGWALFVVAGIVWLCQGGNPEP